ncbi:MAG: hypothetical protein AAFQ82_26835, partial [Myxococcota bacterium]
MLPLILTVCFSLAEPDAVSAGVREPVERESSIAPEEELAGEKLTTEEFRKPFVSPNIVGHVLSLPEHLVELAFTPLGLLVYATERYALHKRIPSWLRNESGTIRVSPDFRFSFGQGFGAGATLSFRSLTRDEGLLAIGALARINADRSLNLRTERRFSTLEGRKLTLSGAYEIDRDREFYGIGNDSTFEDRRTVRDQTLRFRSVFDITPRGATAFVGTARIEFLRQTLLPGEGPRAPPVGSDSAVAPPPGFEQDLDFLSLGTHPAWAFPRCPRCSGSGGCRDSG